MSDERKVSLVVGYVPDVDALPADVERLGLRRRLALVLDTHRPSSPDMVFDEELYDRFLRIVIDAVKADAILVRDGKQEAKASGADELHRLQLARPEEEREPFERIVLSRGAVPVAVVGSEPWARVGGPRPYHDSYTVP